MRPTVTKSVFVRRLDIEIRRTREFLRHCKLRHVESAVDPRAGVGDETVLRDADIDVAIGVREQIAAVAGVVVELNIRAEPGRNGNGAIAGLVSLIAASRWLPPSRS